MNKQEIIEKMQTRIFEHQKENGFETIFDLLNEDLLELIDAIPQPAPTECKEPDIDIEKTCQKCGVHISEHQKPTDEEMEICEYCGEQLPTNCPRCESLISNPKEDNNE